MSTYYVDDNGEMIDGKVPVLRGCSGWCACTGRCKDVVAYMTVEQYEKHKKFKELAKIFSDLAEIKIETTKNW